MKWRVLVLILLVEDVSQQLADRTLEIDHDAAVFHRVQEVPEFVENVAIFARVKLSLVLRIQVLNGHEQVLEVKARR